MDEVDLNEAINLTLTEELDLLLNKEKKYQDSIKIDVSTEKLIKNEMKIFESHPYHKRPETLEKIFLSLKSIPPSSVEAERAFSSASFFEPKIRGNLSDETLTSLVFLRHCMKKDR